MSKKKGVALRPASLSWLGLRLPAYTLMDGKLSLRDCGQGGVSVMISSSHHETPTRQRHSHYHNPWVHGMHVMVEVPLTPITRNIT